MDKYNNLTVEQLHEAISMLNNKHISKKQEITNLTLLIDKKIAELTEIENKYAEFIFVLNKKNKDVIRQEI